MYDAYQRIFQRCGLRVKVVEADTGDMGGSWSHEFMVPADSGEDEIVECPSCKYAANTERAERRVSELADVDGGQPLEEIDTPDAGTIEEVSAFLKIPPELLIKTLIYVADGEPIAVLLPGDREVNEPKLKRQLDARTLEPAETEVVERVTGAPVGFAGPVGLKIPVYADISLRGAADRVTGANIEDKHIAHCTLARDADIEKYLDLAVCAGGDLCPKCGTAMRIARGIEVGHVFKLGTKYSEAFGADYLDAEGQTHTIVMGCYGIGVTRTLQAVVEQNHDANGILWPASVAPCEVGILLLDVNDETCRSIVRDLEDELTASGLDVLVDDRSERPGVKFKDADLIGFPVRVVVGAKALQKGGVELKLRDSDEVQILPLDSVVAIINQKVERGRQMALGS
jgi:prolyl-tRNA synthetase